MKIEKIVIPPPTVPEFKLELTRSEAEILLRIIGSVDGTGSARGVVDDLWAGLVRLGVVSDTENRYSGLITVSHK